METKKATTKKKPTVTKKTTTSAKKTVAKKPVTTVKKTTAAKKKSTTTVKRATANKKTTTAKKTTTKTVTKKTTPTSKTTSLKIDKLIENIDKPVDKVEKLSRESEKVSPIIEEPIIVEKSIEREYVQTETVNAPVEHKVVIKKKRKLKIKPLIRLVIIIAALVLITIYAPKMFNRKDSYKDKATYSNAFFIRNNKGKYALFNESGKKLTDFTFDSVSSFVNNVSLVYKEKEGYAVINNKGKNVIKYGEYNYVSNYQGLFKVRSDKGYKLLDSKGKVLIDSEDLDVNSYGDDYPFVIATTKNEIKIISYDGKTIKTFKKDSSAKSPTVNHIKEYSTVFYNGENIIFNAKTKKVITTFKKDTHYCVSDISDNGEIIALNACTSWYESLNEVGHMILVKGKVTDLSSKCDSINIYDDIAICLNSDGGNFINISGKKATIGEKVNNRTAFIDEKNYVTRDVSTLKLNFYSKGKKVKTMDASLSAIGKMNNDMYVLYVDNGYEFYNKEGKKVIQDSFKYASSFDENGLARVSKNGSSYYLINEKCKKISDEYLSISAYEDYYLVTNKKQLKGVIDKKGKKIVPTKYHTVNIKELRDTYYAITSTEEGKYALYDLGKDKLIKETKHQITINENYIKVSGNKTSYYTYKDKLIFEE